MSEIVGVEPEIGLADRIGGQGVQAFDPRVDDEFRKSGCLVQRRGRFLGAVRGTVRGRGRRGHIPEKIVHDVLCAGRAAHAGLRDRRGTFA